MITQKTKEQVSKLYADGKWWQLAMLIIEFGVELVKYLRELKKSKQDESDKNKPLQS